MASTTLMTTKDGKRFYKIAVSRGRGPSPYTTRWSIPEGWSKRAIDRELNKVAVEFELQCTSGKVLTRSEQREIEAEARREAAKLKTVRQYAEGVFMPSKVTMVAETTRSSYQGMLDLHILPALGDMLLADITPAMLKKLLSDYKSKHYSFGSQLVLYTVLSGIFSMAYLDDSIKANPMDKVQRPKQSKDANVGSDSADAFTVDELRYILSCADKEPLQWRAYLYLAADTGARRGELGGLQWSDIDWQNKRITIKRNLQYTGDKGIYATTPKTGASRIVDIGDDTLALLQKLRIQQSNSCISQWVFTREGESSPMSTGAPSKYFKRFGKRYGIDDFHPHKLRHTSASVAIIEGADVASVSQRLGHKRVSTTLDMYVHSNEESIRRAGQLVRDALKVSGK